MRQQLHYNYYQCTKKHTQSTVKQPSFSSFPFHECERRVKLEAPDGVEKKKTATKTRKEGSRASFQTSQAWLRFWRYLKASPSILSATPLMFFWFILDFTCLFVVVVDIFVVVVVVYPLLALSIRQTDRLLWRLTVLYMLLLLFLLLLPSFLLLCVLLLQC